MPRLRMCGAISLLPHITSWHVQGGTTLRLLVEVMDAFGVRVRFGASLVVAGCKALFSILEPRDSLYSGRDSSSAPPNTLRNCQQSTSEELQLQPCLSNWNSVVFECYRCEWVSEWVRVSEKWAKRIVYCMLAVEMHSGTSASLSVFFQSFFHEHLFLPWKSRIEISALSLSLQHSADTRQIWRLSAPPKSCNRRHSIIIVITMMLIIIYVIRTNKMHNFSLMI